MSQTHTDKVKILAAELLIGPSHEFRKHALCIDFCKWKTEAELPIYKIINDTGMLSCIIEEVRTLVSCANSLIYNTTNNPAECYMSQICKTLGGKRVDFSKGHSIKRRANIAVLAYQMPGKNGNIMHQKF